LKGMKVKINRKQLLKELGAVKAGISQRNIVDQSSCFAFDGKTVMSFNDEIACTLPTCLKIKGAVSADMFLAMLSKLKQKTLNIEASKTKLSIKTGKKGKTGKEYAKLALAKKLLLPINVVDKPKNWQPLAKHFEKALDYVKDCTSKDETRFALTCVNIHPDWIEGCDIIQAARYKIKTGLKKSTLVRKESIKYILNFDMKKFSETKNWMHFKNADGLVVSCRRFKVSKGYPSKEITELMKYKGDKMELPTELVNAIDKAQVFTNDETGNKNLIVKVGNGKISVVGKSSKGEYGKSSEVRYEGREFTFGIAPALLSKLAAKHEGCQISKKFLKIGKGKFQYITCVGVVD